MYAVFGRLSLLMAAFLFSSLVHAQWTNEQVIATTNLYSTIKTSPKSVCANFAASKVIDCVFPNYSASVGNTTIFETQSADGGVSWSTPVQVSNDYSYDPWIEYDSSRQRLNLVYARNTNGLDNSIVIRTKASPSGAWSSATLIAAGSAASAYWEPSVLTLQNGWVDVFYVLNGPESQSGLGSGRIMVSHSTDGGNTWTAPAQITSTCDAEYPRAIQNSYGSIQLLYSRYIMGEHGSRCGDGVSSSGYSYTDIHQIWSNDGGVTWTGESTFIHNPNGSAWHPYIGAETTHRQTACPTCGWDVVWYGQTSTGGIAVYEQQSPNQGASWTAANQISQTTWAAGADGNEDPMFIIGCRGFLVTYADQYPNQNVYNRRYDWSSTCSIN
jgi:hypothetical protein